MRGTLSGAVRFVRARPRTELAGGAAAVALLVTAPFGGLRAAPAPQPDPLEPGAVERIGPFDVELRKVVSIEALSDTVTASEPGRRLLAVVADVTNPGTRPEHLQTLSEVLVPRGEQVVPGDPTPYVVADGGDAKILNPGLTQEIVFVYEHTGTLEQVRLDVLRTDFIEEGGLTLDSNFWLPSEDVAISAELDVEVK